MELVDLKYYVLAMYDQTLFLGQAVVGGAWTLELSTLKLYSDPPSTATLSHCYPLARAMIVRECFWYLGPSALKGARFDRTVGANFQGQTMHWKNSSRVLTLGRTSTSRARY